MSSSGPSAACGGAPPGPASAAPPLGLPRNWTLSATTSILLFLTPSDSQRRCRSRPSTRTGRPLERYSAQFSPSLPKTTMSKNDTSSFNSLFCLYRELTAMPKLVTERPEGRYRISGSRTRLPARMTRLNVTMDSPFPLRGGSGGGDFPRGRLSFRRRRRLGGRGGDGLRLQLDFHAGRQVSQDPVE